MEYITTKLVSTRFVIEDFPAYFKFGLCHRAKVISSQRVIIAAITEWNNGATLDIGDRLGNLDWEPCTDTEFYETAAEAYRRINEGCDIISLQLEGGPYAD